MPWVAVEPKYTRGEVDRAGDVLIDPQSSLFEYHEALQVVNNWRSAHSWPLNLFQGTLRNRAKKVDSNVLVAQRLKRLASIESKLRRFPSMKLARMQDLGGCRAVLRNLPKVYDLVGSYDESESKNKKRHDFVKKFDYIANPKNDGYRGVHLTYKYKTQMRRYEPFNGLRIEIQIRSQVQHAWATAVETVDTFTGQALKSSTGNPRWARFFLLMGSAMALREKTPVVEGAPIKRKELRDELRALAKELKVRTTFMGWQGSLKYVEESGERNADVFLLVFDIDRWVVKPTGFRNDEVELATEAYLTAEKEIAQGANKQAVLVGVDSLAALRKAYPSYYVDTEAFLDALRLAMA